MTDKPTKADLWARKNLPPPPELLNPKIYGKCKLWDTCLDRFRKADLEILADYWMFEAIKHIEKVREAKRGGSVESLRHFIKAVSNSRGKI